MAHERETAGHAALMDGVYRYQRHIYNLTRKYYLFGRDRMIRELKLRAGESAVEIGCGTARNLILMAKAYPEARLFGLDASEEMLRTAREAARRAGVAERIALAHGFAEHLSPAMFGGNTSFDRALFPYSLSMIPDWRAALRVAAGAISRDGLIHVVDFGDFGRLPAPAGRSLESWLGKFHVRPRRGLLHRLEQLPPSPSLSLTVLPGRYAFVLRCAPADIRRLDLPSVAD
jgi:S-adenosylmethionine-diacylgycerolhomoserine-N-methlytransferase